MAGNRIFNTILRVGILILLQQFFMTQPLPSNFKITSIKSNAHTKAPSLEFESNDVLKKAVKLFDGEIVGSESVAVDEKRNVMYLLDRYGRVFESSVEPSSTQTLTPVTYVGPGRPLGVHLQGNKLIICDSLKGLVELDLTTKKISILSNAAFKQNSTQDFGYPVAYADDLDVDPTTGDVYFTDASTIPPAFNRNYYYDTMASYMLTALQGGDGGRLLVYKPSTGKTEVLDSAMRFPNGVALSQDQSYLVIAETCTARLLKHWLKGPKAGVTEVLLDGLPGYPDGVTRASDGAFWVALIAPNSLPARLISNAPPLVRWAVSWIINIVPFPMSPFGMVLKVSGEGQVLQVLQDADGSHVNGISGVMEAGGRLYMGHLSQRYISYINLNQL